MRLGVYDSQYTQMETLVFEPTEEYGYGLHSAYINCQLVMSSQSGIIPSESLVACFHAFTASSNRAIVFSIDIATLTICINQTVSATANLDDDLQFLTSKILKDSDCMYIILRYDEDSSVKHAFISYVPDNAPVRAKMLYASTKNTLLRSLSSGSNLTPILFINSADELSPQGWRNIMESLNSSAPLSESEIQLQKVKQEEILFSVATAAKPTGLTKDSTTNLLFAIDADVEAIISSNLQSNDLVTCYIDAVNETLKLSKLTSNITQSELVNTLAQYATSPAYHLYKNSANQTFFVLTCPSGSKVRERMLYASNKQGLINHLKQNKWEFTKIIEIGDADELELSCVDPISQNLDSESSATSISTFTNSRRFSKPKGPRRR